MHMFAIVLVPEGVDDIDQAVEELMAPHVETATSGWWDYWRQGGGWAGGELDGRYVPVRELPEVRPFTLVAPGVVAHREGWVGADRDNGEWVVDQDWDRTAATILLGHRDHVAVAVDYHC